MSEGNQQSHKPGFADENRNEFVDEDDEFDVLLDRFMVETTIHEKRISQFQFYIITAKLAKLLKEYALNKPDIKYESSAAIFFNSNGC